jgi:hypothetical protein
MIRSILSRVEALEKIYPKPSAGEMVNKRLAAYMRSNPFLKRYVKDLPPTEMDNQQIADFIRSRGFSIFLPGLVPKEYITQQEWCEAKN